MPLTDIIPLIIDRAKEKRTEERKLNRQKKIQDLTLALQREKDPQKLDSLQSEFFSLGGNPSEGFLQQKPDFTKLMKNLGFSPTLQNAVRNGMPIETAQKLNENKGDATNIEKAKSIYDGLPSIRAKYDSPEQLAAYLDLADEAGQKAAFALTQKDTDKGVTDIIQKVKVGIYTKFGDLDAEEQQRMIAEVPSKTNRDEIFNRTDKGKLLSQAINSIDAEADQLFEFNFSTKLESWMMGHLVGGVQKDFFDKFYNKKGFKDADAIVKQAEVENQKNIELQKRLDVPEGNKKNIALWVIDINNAKQPGDTIDDLRAEYIKLISDGSVDFGGRSKEESLRFLEAILKEINE